MSWADAGRKKIEPRTAEFVAVGDIIVDPNGRDYEVMEFGRIGSTQIVLELKPVGQCGSKPLRFKRDAELRVRR